MRSAKLLLRAREHARVPVATFSRAAGARFWDGWSPGLFGGLEHRPSATLATHRRLLRVCVSSSSTNARKLDSCVEIHELRVPGKPSNGAKENLRLDAFLTDLVADSSRARLQTCIKDGMVEVNGAVQSKTGFRLRPGDSVVLALPPPQPLSADPESIPLNIVFEDDDVLVVNKHPDVTSSGCRLPDDMLSLLSPAPWTELTQAAGMVTHPAPGNYTGTLVNAVLGHCNLPSKILSPSGLGPAQPGHMLDPGGDEEYGAVASLLGDGECDDDDIAVGDGGIELREAEAGNIRPGIVHRLDKGTSGLLVVAKSEVALQSLAQQFKDRTVQRTYVSVALRSPSPAQGRVEANVGRDPHDRKRMAAFPYVVGGGRGRHASSNYKVVEALCGERAAVVAWKLDTGRTHQIRVHAKHLGCPLLGDDTYGGGAGTAAGVLGGPGDTAARAAATELVEGLGRPALHAATLGFRHPVSQEDMSFSADVPEDMMAVIRELRGGM